ncbi:hypothetical protein MMC06_002245 [Schaereria dolodes]|nr:hypothetical protein [Schaereria dolodes]
MNKEIEQVKKEYEEKMKKKQAKKKEKDVKEADERKDKDKDEDNDDKAKKEKDDKIKAITNKEVISPDAESIPRIYILQKSFYQMRVDRIRTAEVARRNQQRLKNPSTFPSVPSGEL